MGDELLKKTGAGNLFTVFGEPDVKLTTKGGKAVVTIRGAGTKGTFLKPDTTCPV